MSMVDYGRSDPATKPVFEVESVFNWYCSSTMVPGFPWGVDFWGGYVGANGAGDGSDCIRAVRKTR